MAHPAPDRDQTSTCLAFPPGRVLPPTDESPVRSSEPAPKVRARRERKHTPPALLSLRFPPAPAISARPLLDVFERNTSPQLVPRDIAASSMADRPGAAASIRRSGHKNSPAPASSNPYRDTTLARDASTPRARP